MLVFYPDFDVSCSSAADEVVLLLDTSESMKGESLLSAQRIALQVLRKLDRSLRLNVILFGTGWKLHFKCTLTLQLEVGSVLLNRGHAQNTSTRFTANLHLW